MARMTSIEAYEELKRSGRADMIKGRILNEVIRSDRPLTRLEISHRIGHTINATVGQVRALIIDGVLADDDKIECPITGNLVHGVVEVTAEYIHDNDTQLDLFA